jgi:hypothetical protein
LKEDRDGDMMEWGGEAIRWLGRGCAALSTVTFEWGGCVYKMLMDMGMARVHMG